MRETALHAPEPKPYERVVKITCQFCGAEGPNPSGHNGTWAKSGFDINEVEIRWRQGETYPEGGAATTVFYDCCPACWDGKIRPALDALLVEGETINTDESDW